MFTPGWANRYALNSTSLDDLQEPFRTRAKAFIEALEDVGAEVNANEKLHAVGLRV